MLRNHVNTNGTIEDECTVLRTLLPSRSPGRQQIIRAETTFAHLPDTATDRRKAVEYIQGRIPEVSTDTLADFAAKNSERHDLQSLFDLGESFVVLSDEEIKKLLQTGKGWNGLRAEYPQTHGVMDCSRVGFNLGITEALVYVGQRRAARAGAGWYCLLLRFEDTWTETRSARAWIS